MDINELRTIITTLSFVVFIGIVYWAYNGHQRKAFDEPANLPFIDDEMPESARHNTEKSNGVRS